MKFTGMKKRVRKKMYINNTTRKKVTPRHRTSRDYDFLEYIRIIFKWATSNNDLTRGQIELLLYLYPKGTFSKNQFNQFHRVLGLYPQKTLDKFILEGWVKLWRANKRNQTALYCLTNKAKTLCSRMHSFCVGEREIPLSARSNTLAKEGGARINNYYMDIIKQMIKKRKPEE